MFGYFKPLALTHHEFGANSPIKLRSVIIDAVLLKELLGDVFNALNPNDGVAFLPGEPQQIPAFPAEWN